MTPAWLKEGISHMKIGHSILNKHLVWIVGLTVCGILVTASLVHAQAQHASGGGTYFVEPGIRSQFQFNTTGVQCKVGHAVFPDGTLFQMFMFSTSVDSIDIDIAAKTVTMTGSMVSTVVFTSRMAHLPVLAKLCLMSRLRKTMERRALIRTSFPLRLTIPIRLAWTSLTCLAVRRHSLALSPRAT